MSAPIATHETCPDCGHQGCLTIWEDGLKGKRYNSICMSCSNHRYFDDLEQSDDAFVPKDIREVEIEELEDVISDPYVPESYRGISKFTLEREGVYFTKNTKDNKEVVHYNYPTGVKHRELPKSIRISGKMDSFYGQDRYPGGNVITITEGEEDRLSVIEMMGDYPAVSLPGATPSKLFWESAREYLSNFEKIVLSVDADEAGDRVAKKIFNLFPGKVYRVNHGKHKDANDFLLCGDKAQYKSAWWNAQKIKPENILSSKEDFINLFNETPDYEYFPTGIPGLDEKMLGIHKGALTIVLAETGIGKTELFRYLEYQCLKETDYTIGICHGEETKLRSMLGLLSYHENMNLTRKDLVEENDKIEAYENFLEWCTKDEKIYQFSIRVDEGVDDIISQIRFLVTAMGVDYIFLEPLQDFVSASSTTEKESLLTDLTNKLKRLAPEINVGIVAIAHSNKDGEAKYAASIIQGAAYEIRLKRDDEASDPLEKNRMHVYVGRKNRTGGGSGYAGSLDFDIESYTLKPYLGPIEPDTEGYF